MSTPSAPHFAVDEFERRIGEGDPGVRGRAELRCGRLYNPGPTYIPYMRVRDQIRNALDESIISAGLPLEVGSCGGVRYGGGFIPAPDVLVFEPSGSLTLTPLANVRLIAEIADNARRRKDLLGPKRLAYAEAGLLEYWVADFKERVVHRFSAPTDCDYGCAAKIPEGEEIASDTLPGVAIGFLFP
jgi:Uma2 family endonuclease